MNKYEVARDAIICAKKELEKGDYDSAHLANYILRGLDLVKEAGLTDLAWAMHRNNLHKNDVLGLIEYLEKYMSKSSAALKGARCDS